MMNLTGRSLIGYTSASGQGPPFSALNPATGNELEPTFLSATAEEVSAAALLAARAYESYSRSSGRQRAAFLGKVAGYLELAGDQIVQRASLETGLAESRLHGELARTCNQLRLFADLVLDGSWVDARIDHGDATRKPTPKPDVRSMMRPLGPVAVFGSSNFPLAFSVAGGDTASALAAGCPVIVKAHPAHPGTSELVATALQTAARDLSLPEGVFSCLFDAGFSVGLTLVRHPSVQAVGFTGSRKGGNALVSAAASRPVPIPVYAEMGSVNPVFILPGAMRTRGREIASGLHASVTMGTGQYCTCPGLVFVNAGQGTEQFLRELEKLMAATPAGTMLTKGIVSEYSSGVERLASTDGVIARVKIAPQAGRTQCGAALFTTEAGTFLKNRWLMDEVFGPSTLAVVCEDQGQLLSAAHSLEGQLTATLHGTEADFASYRELTNILEKKVGRIVLNGFPTGVEVCHAMVHGGPYPATSDGRSTSVGTRAIRRFTRPLCFQNFTDALLPDELKEGNPLGIWRLTDGNWTR